MFFKTVNSNKISSVFDPKLDQCVKIKKEYEPNLECNLLFFIYLYFLQCLLVFHPSLYLQSLHDSG